MKTTPVDPASRILPVAGRARALPPEARREDARNHGDRGTRRDPLLPGYPGADRPLDGDLQYDIDDLAPTATVGHIVNTFALPSQACRTRVSRAPDAGV